MMRSFADMCRSLVNNLSRLLMMPVILIMRINEMNTPYLELKNILNAALTDRYLLMFLFWYDRVIFQNIS